MGWTETLANARNTVHATFRRPAVYTSPLGVVTNVWVRLHADLKVFGDLDREGYARVAEEINQVIFDSTEIVPQKGAVVDLGVDSNHAPIPGADFKYDITYTTPKKGNRYIPAEVTIK